MRWEKFCHIAVVFRNATARLKAIPNRIREILNDHDAAGGILFVEGMGLDPLVDQYLRKFRPNPFSSVELTSSVLKTWLLFRGSFGNSAVIFPGDAVPEPLCGVTRKHTPAVAGRI